MNYVFPENFYTDVRIEHLYSTRVVYTFEELDECKVREFSAAFIRVYDGTCWYYASTSDLNSIQTEINALAKLATKNPHLLEMPIYNNFSSLKEKKIVFRGKEVSKVGLDDKISLLRSIMPLLKDNKYLKLWTLTYLDEYKIKEFYNSKGADLTWDFQRTGFSIRMRMAEGERQLQESFQLGKTNFLELRDFEKDLAEKINECEKHLLESEAVLPGTYTVVLAPLVTGVFAHECFGHKSESDFMVGDEETKKEWALGKKIGSANLSIIETGLEPGSGYVPFDDEGNAATKTYVIKNGILSGRLHHGGSAADLEEEVTGNARAIDFEFEPIVRMTTTYIDGGNQTVDELIGGLKSGIYVKNIMHGSGMSTFTLAPTIAYYIKDGKIDKPIRISVVSGNVFETLENIDGIADDLEMTAFVTGGCGKMDQAGLAVGFGGPHIRVKNMQVQ